MNGLPGTRKACAEIGPVWYRGHVRQRICDVDGDSIVA